MKMFDDRHRIIFVGLLVAVYELMIRCDMRPYDDVVVVVVEMDNGGDVNGRVHVVWYIHLHYLNHRSMKNLCRVLDLSNDVNLWIRIHFSIENLLIFPRSYFINGMTMKNALGLRPKVTWGVVSRLWHGKSAIRNQRISWSTKRSLVFALFF